MNDIDIDKLGDIGKCIAALDSIVLSCREQQIALGKILAKDLNRNECAILQALKESSIEMLHKNGLDY